MSLGSLQDVLVINKLISETNLKNVYSDSTDRFVESVISQLKGFGIKAEKFSVMKGEQLYEGLKLNHSAKDTKGDFIDTLLIESNGITSRIYGLDNTHKPYKFAIKNPKAGETRAKGLIVEGEAKLETKHFFLNDRQRMYKTLLEAKTPYYMEKDLYEKHLTMREKSTENIVEGSIVADKVFNTLTVNDNYDICYESLLDKDSFTSSVVVPVEDLLEALTFIEAPIAQQVRVEMSKLKSKTGKVVSKMSKLPKGTLKKFKALDAKLRRAMSNFRSEKDAKLREKVLQDEMIPLLDNLWGWLLALCVGYGALAIPVVGPVVAVVGFITTKIAVEMKDKKNYKRALKIFDNEIEVTVKKLELAQMKNDEKAIIALTRAKQGLEDERDKHLKRTSALSIS